MTIEIRLLGMFEVRRGGKPVPASAWSRRYAAALVTAARPEPWATAAPGAGVRRAVA